MYFFWRKAKKDGATQFNQSSRRGSEPAIERLCSDGYLNGNESEKRKNKCLPREVESPDIYGRVQDHAFF